MSVHASAESTPVLKKFVSVKLYGLYGAGKSTIIKHFLEGKVVEVEATVRKEEYDFSFKGIPVKVTEYAGQVSNWDEWLSDEKCRQVFGDVDLAVIVVDIANEPMLSNQAHYVCESLKKLSGFNPEVRLHLFMNKMDLLRARHQEDWEKVLKKYEKFLVEGLPQGLLRKVSFAATSTKDDSDLVSLRGVLMELRKDFAGKIAPVEGRKAEEEIPDEIRTKFAKLQIRAIQYAEFTHSGGVQLKGDASRRYWKGFPRVTAKELENLHEAFIGSRDLVSSNEKFGSIVGVSVERAIGDEAQGTRRKGKDTILIFAEPGCNKTSLAKYRQILTDGLEKNKDTAVAGAVDISLIEKIILSEYKVLVKEIEVTKKPLDDLIHFFGASLLQAYHIMLTRSPVVIEEFGELERFDPRTLALISPVSFLGEAEVTIFPDGAVKETSKAIKRLLTGEENGDGKHKLFIVKEKNGEVDESFRDLPGWVVVSSVPLKERAWLKSTAIFNVPKRKFTSFPVPAEELEFERIVLNRARLEADGGKEADHKAEYGALISSTNKISLLAERAAEELSEGDGKLTRAELFRRLGVQDAEFKRVLTIMSNFLHSKLAFRTVKGDTKDADPLDLLDGLDGDLEKAIPKLLEKIYQTLGRQAFSFRSVEDGKAKEVARQIKRNIKMLTTRDDLSEENKNLVASYAFVKTCSHVNGEDWVKRIHRF